MSLWPNTVNDKILRIKVIQNQFWPKKKKIVCCFYSEAVLLKFSCAFLKNASGSNFNICL